MKTKNRILGKIAVPVVLVAMSLLFMACPRGKYKTEYVDLGNIPEEYLATVPYKDGDVIKMQHENTRLVINYRVSRIRNKTFDESGDIIPPKVVYSYEVDYTELKPDYPTFDISVFFTNAYMQYEQEGQEAPKTAGIGMGTSSVSLPFIGTDAAGYTILDSLEVNGRTYYDVFKLDGHPYTSFENPIYAATCYYNYAKGFIGIEMSNNERYWLYEE